MKPALTLLLSLLTLNGGCTLIEYRTPEGGAVRVAKFGETKIGKLELKTPDGRTVVIENLDSNGQMVQAVQSAISKLP